MPDTLTLPTVTGGPHTVPELMTAGGRGWDVSRGTPAPVAVPSGFRVDVSLPGHRVRQPRTPRTGAVAWDASSCARSATKRRGHGTHTGILVATHDGRAFYSALGRTVHSPVSGAFARGPGLS